MMPTGALSTQAVSGSFVEKRRRRSIPLVDYELGGVAIADSSKGLQVQQWMAECTRGVITVSADSGAPYVYDTGTSTVVRVALAFDQAMQPILGWSLGTGESYLRYYNGVGFTIMSLPDAVKDLCLTLDDKRAAFSAQSDVILAYVLNNNLYYRQQRDVYNVENLLASSIDASLTSVGMNTKNRLQFQMSPYSK